MPPGALCLRPKKYSVAQIRALVALSERPEILPGQGVSVATLRSLERFGLCHLRDAQTDGVLMQIWSSRISDLGRGVLANEAILRPLPPSAFRLPTRRVTKKKPLAPPDPHQLKLFGGLGVLS